MAREKTKADLKTEIVELREKLKANESTETAESLRVELEDAQQATESLRIEVAEFKKALVTNREAHHETQQAAKWLRAELKEAKKKIDALEANNNANIAILEKENAELREEFGADSVPKATYDEHTVHLKAVIAALEQQRAHLAAQVKAK